MSLVSVRNPNFADVSDHGLIQLAQDINSRRKEIYRKLDAIEDILSPSIIEFESQIDDIDSESFRIDDELCARGLDWPKY